MSAFPSCYGLRLALVSAAALLSCPQLSEASLRRSVNPELDPKSDKEFFGPPFPADYPSDLRPSGKHAFNYPFPHVQGSSTFDTDYVKDENSDNGEWQAQMDYDTLRAQLQKAKKEAEEAKKNQAAEADDADKAKGAYDDAKRDEKEAQEKADEAAKNAKEAADKVGDVKMPESPGDGAFENRIEQAKKKVEDKIKNLDDCKQQLKDAQDALKALLEETQKKREEEAAEHAEERQEAAVKKGEAQQTADSAASGAAKAKQGEETAEKLTDELKGKLEVEKAEEEKAGATYKKEQDDVDELTKKLKAAEDRLRAIRSGKPMGQDGDHRSAAPAMALSLSFLMLAAMVVH